MSSPDREKEREMIRRIVPLLFYVSFEKLERLERLLRLEIKDKD